MNRLPPEPLDDEERALAALIAREGPHGEPSPALDAKILAAAHSAVAGGRTVKRKPRWPVFTGAAASVLLAAGIGWQMLAERDQAAAVGEAPATASTAMIEPDRQQVEVAAAPEAPPPPPPAPATAKIPPPAPAVAPASTKPAPARDAAAMPESAAATAAEPAFAPPPPAAIDVPAAAQRKAMRAEQRAADAREAAPMMQSAPAPAAAEAAVMADSVSLRDIPVEEDAQLPERDWLQRIEQRLAQGDRDGARDSLRRFSGKYPQTELPPELRALLEE